jgi:signal transduction histidine kinase
MADPSGGPADAPTTVRLTRRDGQTITVEVSPAQKIDFDGPARLIVALDVSERVALQQRLITADRIASIGLLGAGVAHEINNPLAYTLASLELATRRVSKLESAPPELAELLVTAREGVERVRTIVHDLGMLTRTDELPTLPIDVREVLDSTLTLAAGSLPARLSVVRDYRSVPLALAHGPRLGQVALNLVLNAVESMAGPGELRVRTLLDHAGRVAFEVEDTGTGIAPDVASRIFDPFFTTKPAGRGTGLGLAICHYIVAGFGGEISVQSAVGRGSTFRVALPPVPAALSESVTANGTENGIENAAAEAPAHP